MAGIKIVDLPPLGRDLASTDLLELSLAGGTGSRKITGQEIMNTSKLNIGTTAIISGTVGRVLFEGTGNVVSESANLFWDNTNNYLGIGTSTPARRIDISGSGDVVTGIKTTSATGASAHVVLNDVNSSFEFGMWGSTRAGYGAISSNNAYIYGGVDFAITTLGNIKFGTGASVAERMRIVSSNGNVLINTLTDAGFKLDVNGTARVSGNVTLNNTSGTNRSTDIRTSAATDNFAATAFYPSSGTNVGQSFQVIPRGTGYSGSIKAQFTIAGTDLIADGTNYEAMVVRATGSAFTFATGKGGTGTIRPMLFSSGFLDGATNANQLWLYSTGNVGINTTTDDGFKLDVNGTARVQTSIQSPSVVAGATNGFGFALWVGNTARFEGGANFGAVGTIVHSGTEMYFNNISTGPIIFRTNTNVERLRIFGSTGNIAINTTTDAGYKLDVNGTARVQGNTRITGQINFGNNNIWIGAAQWSAGLEMYAISAGSENIKLSAAQQVNISSSSLFTANASAILQVDSTTKGFLPPRMTQAQRNAIASPAIGLEIYQTDATEGKYIYKSSGWTYIG